MPTSLHATHGDPASRVMLSPASSLELGFSSLPAQGALGTSRSGSHVTPEPGLPVTPLCLPELKLLPALGEAEGSRPSCPLRGRHLG